MSVQGTTTRWVYAPDGVATTFAYNNLAQQATDLTVYSIDQNGNPVALPGYAVTGLGNPLGGTVVFNSAPLALAGSGIFIELTPSLLSSGADPADYVQASAAARRYDRDQALLVGQRAAQLFRRTLQASPFDLDNALVLPPPALRKGMALLFDAVLGMPVVGAPLSPGVLAVAAYMQTALAQNNAGQLFTYLGVSAFMQGLFAEANAAALLTAEGFSAFVQGILGSANATAFQAAIGVPVQWTVGTNIAAAANINLAGGTPGDERGIGGPPVNITTITGTQRLVRLTAKADGITLVHDGVNITSRTASNIVMRNGDQVDLALTGANTWLEVGFRALPNWKSANLAIVYGTSLAPIAHNLGKRVGTVRMFAVCTANDGTWTPADFAGTGARLEVPSSAYSTNAWSYLVDDTNVTVHLPAGGLVVVDKGNTTNFVMTAANWNFWLEIDPRD